MQVRYVSPLNCESIKNITSHLKSGTGRLTEFKLGENDHRAKARCDICSRSL